jgi:ribosomal protein S18 acetylase RimI-like enzyme
MKVGVRDAQGSDIPFVRRLAQESILYTIPYGRTTQNSVVQARVRENLRGLEPSEDMTVLIAYRQDNERAIGYLILQLNELDDATGDRQSYIYDLAVEPRYWGTPAVRLLVREAARRTHQAGLHYMSGEISAHNQRTYLQALRLGFELERLKIVMACDESGPAPLPKRPDQQRAYDSSRRKAGRKSENRLPGSWKEARASRPGRAASEPEGEG